MFQVVFFLTICTLMFVYLAGFLTRESDLCRSRRPPFSVYPYSLYLRDGGLTVCPRLRRLGMVKRVAAL